MIQRIQSVYLLLAALAAGLLFFFPIATFWDDISFLFAVNYVKDISNTPQSLFNQVFTVPSMVISGINALLPLVILFLFKNRKLQMQLVKLTGLMILSFIALIFFYYVPTIENTLQVEADYSGHFGMYLPLASLVFMVLAYRGIAKDEKLVRAADRLR